MFPAAIISLQECALHLLHWTKELTENSSKLIVIFCEGNTCEGRGFILKLHDNKEGNKNHRYTTLNRDRKQRHAPCILPVQLTSLVGNEAGFAQNRFERLKNCSNSF